MICINYRREITCLKPINDMIEIRDSKNYCHHQLSRAAATKRDTSRAEKSVLLHQSITLKRKRSEVLENFHSCGSHSLTIESLVCAESLINSALNTSSEVDSKANLTSPITKMKNCSMKNQFQFFQIKERLWMKTKINGFLSSADRVSLFLLRSRGVDLMKEPTPYFSIKQKTALSFARFALVVCTSNN